jgi:hypothetical protein
MATSIEAAVQAVFLGLTSTEATSVTLPKEYIGRLQAIRDVCAKAEQNEAAGSGAVGWRRGAPQNRGGGGHSGRWRRGAPTTQPAAGGATHVAQQSMPHAPNRYVSKFINSEAPLEEKILNQVILNKLNKFSAVNYDDVKGFMQQVLDSDEMDFIHDFMLLVFKKAACEPTFCALYARLVAELSVNYPQLKNEFEKLYTKYMDIFQEVPESKCKDYEEFVQRNREKIHRLGYSQFLGELTRLGVLDIQHLQNLYETILTQLKQHASEGTSKQQVVEEYVDCLLRMSRAFQSNSHKVLALRSELVAGCEPVLEDILARRSADFPGLSKKASFAIMDCLDLFRGTTR